MTQLVYFPQKKYNRVMEVLSMNYMITKKVKSNMLIDNSIVVYHSSIKTGNMCIVLSSIKDRQTYKTRAVNERMVK
jgi:hypothetical protein